MSIRRKIRKDGKRTKVRRDAKLLNLPERDRKLVAEWVQSDGESLCLQRIASQLHIQCSKTTLYAALAFWESEQENDKARAMALAQLRQEEESKGMTPAEFMAALDRRMAMLKAAAKDDAGYQDARYLIVADESARTKAELEKAKLALRQMAESRSKEALKLEREKFETGIRTKVEAGLAEIAKQVKGNAKAEAALARLMEEIKA
jgi:hypothetical protein